MPVEIDSPEGHIIRKMIPFSTMPNSIFKVICDKLVIETARSGTFLFKRGDTLKELIYLLKGEVSLEVEPLKMEVIQAGSESARFALAHQIPRKVNGVAKGTVQFLRLNSIYITTPDFNALKKLPAPVAKESNDQNWISTLLMMPALRALPPTQLNKINEQLEEINYEENEIVVNQGDIGRYYYLIKSGECSLSYKTSDPEQTLITSHLKAGNSFGAEALISSSLRNPTITAISKLSLLRINKDNFLRLVKQPSLKFVDELEMQKILANGGLLLDVSTMAEYKKSPLEHAINVPLLELRHYLKTLDKEKSIVVISHEQHLTESAAFLLLSYKFSAYVSRKNREQSPSELRINVRTAATHDFSDVILEDDLVVADAMVIKTRSVPNHSVMPDLLVAENKDLKRQLQELKLRLEQSEQEKQGLTQKYRLLLKQSERLKVMLEALTK